MGRFLNPGSKGFQTILNAEYVDKSGLIGYINSTINTPQKLTCFSRPRRFGKSFAARMLCAYYDRGIDSHILFDRLNIAAVPSYEQYINKFDVIYLDITRFISTIPTADIVREMQIEVIKELQNAFPDCVKKDETILADALFSVSEKTGRQFVVIIDEWDALFREAQHDESIQRSYVMLLRSLFKAGPTTDETIAAAYLTGILPIKRYGTQSALTDFQEYTMTAPDNLVSYVGFTEEEVQCLCQKHKMDFLEMKRWYDGYVYAGAGSLYSPNSVMSAIRRRKLRSYWTSSETYEALKQYIHCNFDGLRDAVTAMLGGQAVPVDILTFQNDMTSMNSKDDILTLLVHLGYLTYHEDSATVNIPNLEVSDAFHTAVRTDGWEKISEALAQSEQLLQDTIEGKEDKVSTALDEIHAANTSVLRYNDENSLSCAITIAYYTAKKDYTITREFPTGKGFADMVFLPVSGSSRPALLVELKYDQSADSAISQIHERRYMGSLKQYCGQMLLVGINYDRKTKRHSCIIERCENAQAF